MKKLMGMTAVIVLFVGVLLINVHCLPMHDEIAYAFAGETTPMTGEVLRTDSASLFLERQVNDYLHGVNGRIVLHSAVAAFSVLGTSRLFDVVNSLVWMAFVFLLMKYGQVSFTARNYIFVFLAAFALLWYSQSCSFDSAFAMNYLWMATALLLVMSSWVKGCPNVLVFFLFGWMQETFVLPFLSAGAADMILNRPNSWRRPVCWLMMAIGAAGLTLAPSAYRRACGELPGEVLCSIVSVVSVLPRAALYVAPVVLFAALFLIARQKITTLGLKSFLRKCPFEAWYVVASSGMLVLLPKDFSPRLMMAAGTVAFVLMLRHRSCLPSWTRRPRLRMGAAMAVGIWFSLTVAMQIAAGRDNRHMLESYARGGDLVRSYVPLFGYTADRGQFSAWHLRLLQLEYDQDKIGKLTADFETPMWVRKMRDNLQPWAYARIKFLLPDREALAPQPEF